MRHTRSLSVLALAALAASAVHAQLSATTAWESSSLENASLRGAAFGPDGSLYACQEAKNRVLIFANTGGTLSPAPVAVGVTAPKAVAIHPNASPRRMYVVSGQAVQVWNLDATPPVRVSPIPTFPAIPTAFPDPGHLRFSADGNTLFVTVHSRNTGGQYFLTRLLSVVLVWKRTTGDNWADTGITIAPPGNTRAKGDDNPINQQGRSFGLAEDPAGNVWVSGSEDPMAWDGTLNAGTSYQLQYGHYVRPLRFYQRIVENGSESYRLAAVVPLDNKVLGLAMRSDGVLFASESINTSIASAPAGLALSHRVYAYRGTQRVGYIETNATPSTGIVDLQSLDVRPGDTGPTVQGRRGATAYIQRYDVSGIPPALPAWVVQGQVTDAWTGAAIAGATVRLYDQTTVTDAGGFYQVTVPDSGYADVQNPGVPMPPDPYYILDVTAPGYTGTQVNPLRIHENAVWNLQMHAPGQSASMTLGANVTRRGLTFANVLDADTEVAPGDHPGITARRTLENTVGPPRLTGNRTSDYRVAFQAEPTLMQAPGPAFLSIRWLDDGTAMNWTWQVHQNWQTGLPAPRITRSGIPRLRTDTIYVPDAKKPSPANSSFDFALNDFADAGLRIAIPVVDVTVSRSAPPIQTVDPPAGWAGGWAPPNDAVAGAPTVYNGVAYVPLRDGGMVALDLSAPSPNTGFRGTGIVRFNSPVAGRPVVYLGAGGQPHVVVATRNGIVYSLNATTGISNWGQDDGSQTPIPHVQPLGEGSTISSAPCVYMDTSVSPPAPVIWVGINKDGQAHLVRLRGDDPSRDMIVLPLTDGTSAESVISCAPALGAGGTRVMAGYTQGGVGHLLMVGNPPLGGGGGSAPTVYVDIPAPGEQVQVPATLARNGTTLLLGTGNGLTGHVWAVNKDNGQPAWSVEIGSVDTPMWMDYAPPAETLYAVTRDGRVHALDLTRQGQPRPGWPLRTPGVTPSGTLFTAGNNLYAGCDMGLLMVNKTAPNGAVVLREKPLWQYSKPEALTALDMGASLTGQRTTDMIVATGSDGRLHAIPVQP